MMSGGRLCCIEGGGPIIGMDVKTDPASPKREPSQLGSQPGDIIRSKVWD